MGHLHIILGKYDGKGAKVVFGLGPCQITIKLLKLNKNTFLNTEAEFFPNRHALQGAFSHGISAAIKNFLKRT